MKFNHKIGAKTRLQHISCKTFSGAYIPGPPLPGEENPLPWPHPATPLPVFPGSDFGPPRSTFLDTPLVLTDVNMTIFTFFNGSMYDFSNY